MDLATRVARLKWLYQRHNDFFARRQVACQKFCAACCTCNVTVTTLEGYLIVSSLHADGLLDRLPSVRRTLAGRRLQPQVTTNALAVLCMQGQAPPDEASDPRWGPCPFLEREACTIYQVRPFGCRAMMSGSDCRRTGYATMDELALTVNNIFLQAIEHLDAGGFSGNLSDIIHFFSSNGVFEAYRDNTTLPIGKGLIANQPLEMLMVPPEHRRQVEDLLRSLGFLK